MKFQFLQYFVSADIWIECLACYRRAIEVEAPDIETAQKKFVENELGEDENGNQYKIIRLPQQEKDEFYISGGCRYKAVSVNENE